MSVDPCANVMPVLGGFIRRRPRNVRNLKEPAPVKESRTRSLIDQAFMEGRSSRYSHLRATQRASQSISDIAVKGKTVPIYKTVPLTKAKNSRQLDTTWSRDTDTDWQRMGRSPKYQGIKKLMVPDDYSVRGPAVIMLADEDGNHKLGAGADFTSAADSLASTGKGTSFIDQCLDLYSATAFVANSDYHLKQVICREEKIDASNTLIARLKLIFRIPDNLDLLVGWSNSLGGPFEALELKDFLGRKEKEKRLPR